ncbi:hypothetical protein AAMO2058_000044300 [Amorphochlora amoebiformis]
MEIVSLSVVVVIHVYIGLKLCFWIYAKCCRCRMDLRRRFPRGSSDIAPWALVTGGSSGIGLGFCEDLAEAGFNIIMLASNSVKLTRAAEGIRRRFGVEVRCLVVELAESGPHVVSTIKSTLQELDVSLVINNAGISRRLPDDFHTISLTELKSRIALSHFLERRHIDISGISTCDAMNSFVGIPSRGSRKGGLVILSSITGRFPTPGMSSYAASKAFDRSLALSLALEYQPKGVDILALSPAYVQSALSGASRLGGFPPVVSPRSCAKGALDCLGYERETTGHWKHDLQLVLMSWTPSILLDIEIQDEIARFRRRKEAYLRSHGAENAEIGEELRAESKSLSLPIQNKSIEHASNVDDDKRRTDQIPFEEDLASKRLLSG